MADLPDDLLSSKTSLHSIKQFWTAASPCLRSGSTINQAIVRRKCVHQVLSLLEVLLISV
uniref:Uncharacterized protein n=1 Tax=Helianthus annuus TaxID=4232 RepID=A0A251RUL2_HELAN